MPKNIMPNPMEFRILRALKQQALNRTEVYAQVVLQGKGHPSDAVTVVFDESFSRLHLRGHIHKSGTHLFSITATGSDMLEYLRDEYRRARAEKAASNRDFNKDFGINAQSNAEVVPAHIANERRMKDEITALKQQVAFLRGGLQLVADASPTETSVKALVSHAETTLRVAKDSYGG